MFRNLRLDVVNDSQGSCTWQTSGGLMNHGLSVLSKD